MEESLFTEFFACPHCGEALISREELRERDKEDHMNYCTRCGEPIASAYKEALARS